MEFMTLWSDWLSVGTELFVPTLRRSVLSSTRLLWIGFRTHSHVVINIMEETSEQLTDYELVMQTHLFEVLAALREMWLYIQLPGAFPWKSVGILKDSLRDTVLGDMRQVSNLIQRLQMTGDSAIQEYAKELTHTRWVVFRELLEI
jgi:hypothetical protein